MSGPPARTLIVAALWSLGCAPEAPTDQPSRIVRDSAGVRVIEYSAPPVSPARWSVAADPEVRLGAMEGVGPDVFGAIIAVAESHDGTLAVADRQAQELRVFDAAGAHLWTAGGQGDGPGEFTGIAGLAFVQGDSVAAFDGRTQRITVFTPDGRYGRDYRLEQPTRASGASEGTPLGDEGGFVGLGVLTTMESLPQQSGVTRYEGRGQLLFHDAEGRLVSEGPEVSLGEFVIDRQDRFYSSSRLPMGVRTQLAVGSDAAFISDQRQFEVFRYGPTGSLAEVVRVDGPRVAADHRAYQAATAEDRSNASSPMGPGPSDLSEVLPDSLPPLGEMSVGTDGSLWIQEYVPPYEDRPAWWWVLDSGGEFVARVELPRGFALWSAGPVHVVGVSLDSLGVAYVEKYRLIK